MMGAAIGAEQPQAGAAAQPLSHPLSQPLSQHEDFFFRLPNSLVNSPPLFFEQQPLSHAETSQPQAGSATAHPPQGASQPQVGASQQEGASQQLFFLWLSKALSSPPRFLVHPHPLSHAGTSQPHAGSAAHPPQGASQPHAGSAAHPPQGASQPHAGSAAHPPQGASQPQAGSSTQPQAGASQPHAGSAAHPPQGASQPHAGSAAHPPQAGASQPQVGASHGAAAHPVSQQEPLLQPFINFWSKSIP